MPNLLKNQVSQDLKRRLGALDGYVVVDYRGLDSAQTFDLRHALNTAKIRMAVVPNRLAVRVLDRWDGKNKEFRDFFRGPTALVYGDDGALSASKVIAGWKRKNKDLLLVKGGVLSGRTIPSRTVDELAKIPDRPHLLAQLAGQILGPVTRLAVATQGIVSRVVYALEAIRKMKEGESGGGPPASPG